MNLPTMHLPNQDAPMLDNATLANLHALKLLGFADGLQEQELCSELVYDRVN